MVRLPKNISVPHPELPLLISRNSSRDSESKTNERAKTSERFPNLKKFSISSDSSDVVSRARAVIQRFERLSAISSIDVKPPETEQDHAVTDGQAATACTLDSKSDASSLRVEASSVHTWLDTLLKESENVQKVEEQLHLLGFSDKLLRTNEDTSARNNPAIFQDGWPMERLQTGSKLNRSIAILDRTTTLQTHKVALLFAGPASVKGLEFEKEMESSFEDVILKATQGSKEFLEFTTRLSDIVLTRHLNYFSGGLDTSEYQSDGVYAAAWLGEESMPTSPVKTMILFHLVTLMPEGLNNRKRHVGNDNVQIVYVEQGYAFQPEIDRWGHVGDLHSAVVSGQFGFVTIFVMALKDLVRITVRIRAGLPEDAKAVLRNLTGSCVVAKESAPGYVRRVAIRADLACRAAMEDRLGLASNWEDRRQQICDLRRYLQHS